MWKGCLLIALCYTSVATGHALVQLTGKQLLKGKVMGSGYSLPAKSLMQCMDACNEHTSTCDGIVYHENIGKCRMINKCAAAIQIDNSSAAVYFSKRPIIKSDGYLHVPEADSCVGLMREANEYVAGDHACAGLKARLAVVKTLRANKVATNILMRAGVPWAWIADNHTGNNVSGAGDGFKPDVLEKNGTGKGCWAISVSGQWRQYPCKNYTLPSLCEIMPFPA